MPDCEMCFVSTRMKKIMIHETIINSPGLVKSQVWI